MSGGIPLLPSAADRQRAAQHQQQTISNLYVDTARSIYASLVAVEYARSVRAAEDEIDLYDTGVASEDDEPKRVQGHIDFGTPLHIAFRAARAFMATLGIEVTLPPAVAGDTSPPAESQN